MDRSVGKEEVKAYRVFFDDAFHDVVVDNEQEARRKAIQMKIEELQAAIQEPDDFPLVWEIDAKDE